MLIHTCFNPEFQTAPPAVGCTCKRMITFKDRDARIGRGEARYVQGMNSNERAVTDFRQIVMLRKQTKVPRAPTIEKAHIERAFVHGYGEAADKAERERMRIEAYGGLNELNWIGLGAILRIRQAESPGIPAGLFHMSHQGAVIPDIRPPSGANRKGVNVPKEVPAFCEVCQAYFDAVEADAGKCPKCGAGIAVTDKREGFGDGAVAVVPA